MRKLTLPLKRSDIETLAAGEIVALSGTVYTARDAAHKRITETLAAGGPLPFPLEAAAIYYCGPTPAAKGEIIGSCGPTTSARMDAYSPALIDAGVRVMIGKGNRNPAVVEAMRRNCAVYFAAVGGAAALIRDAVTACACVAYPELGCEAVYKLTVRDMELITAIDCRGNTMLQ